jgi:two-component system response regulator AlgR
MTPLRVMIVDDESLARLRLRQLVGDCRDPSAEVVGEAADGSQALDWLAANTCDVVLLDVQMPGLDGTQLAARLRSQEAASSATSAPASGLPLIIFVTAHAEHALRAFELDAVDYLTKPVRRERLQAALQRAAARRASPAPAGASAPSHEAPVIVVSERGRVLRVPIDEVLYLKAELKYVTLRTAAQAFVLDDALSDLESRLGDRFLRIHRNALVARRAVRALERRLITTEGDDEAGEGWAVRLAGVDEWLAVSRRQVAAVREALQSASL